MFIYQYILLLGFVGLCFNKETRLAAVTFLIAWAIYLCVAFGSNFEQYFILSAFIELGIGYSLNKKYKQVSYVSYFLILVNAVGLILHINSIKDYYNDIYAALSIYQFALLLSRLVPNGIHRHCIQCISFRVSNYDCSKAYVKVYKITKADIKYK